MPLATENKPCEGCGFDHTILLREVGMRVNNKEEYKQFCKICAKSFAINPMFITFHDTRMIRWVANHTLVETAKMLDYHYNGGHTK